MPVSAGGQPAAPEGLSTRGLRRTASFTFPSSFFSPERRGSTLTAMVMRLVGLLLIVAVALGALWWVQRQPSPQEAPPPQLTRVVTAHQLGVVGYRDPAGVISPDGTRFAYAEGRHIRVMPIAGGEPVTLAPGQGQIRYLAWSSNDTLVAEDATSDGRWWSYRVEATDRQPLWKGLEVPVNDLRQLTWSADGKMAAAISIGKDGAQLWKLAPDGTVIDSRAVKGRVSSPA